MYPLVVIRDHFFKNVETLCRSKNYSERGLFFSAMIYEYKSNLIYPNTLNESPLSQFFVVWFQSRLLIKFGTNPLCFIIGWDNMETLQQKRDTDSSKLFVLSPLRIKDWNIKEIMRTLSESGLSKLRPMVFFLWPVSHEAQENDILQDQVSSPFHQILDTLSTQNLSSSYSNLNENTLQNI